MTHYDRLMDAIKDHLYTFYVSGQQLDKWDETDAQETARSILFAVEEFQQKRVLDNKWRASD